MRLGVPWPTVPASVTIQELAPSNKQHAPRPPPNRRCNWRDCDSRFHTCRGRSGLLPGGDLSSFRLFLVRFWTACQCLVRIPNRFCDVSIAQPLVKSPLSHSWRIRWLATSVSPLTCSRIALRQSYEFSTRRRSSRFHPLQHILASMTTSFDTLYCFGCLVRYLRWCSSSLCPAEVSKLLTLPVPSYVSRLLSR